MPTSFSPALLHAVKALVDRNPHLRGSGIRLVTHGDPKQAHIDLRPPVNKGLAQYVVFAHWNVLRVIRTPAFDDGVRARVERICLHDGYSIARTPQEWTRQPAEVLWAKEVAFWDFMGGWLGAAEGGGAEVVFRSNPVRLAFADAHAEYKMAHPGYVSTMVQLQREHGVVLPNRYFEKLASIRQWSWPQWAPKSVDVAFNLVCTYLLFSGVGAPEAGGLRLLMIAARAASAAQSLRSMTELALWAYDPETYFAVFHGDATEKWFTDFNAVCEVVQFAGGIGAAARLGLAGLTAGEIGRLKPAVREALQLRPGTAVSVNQLAIAFSAGGLGPVESKLLKTAWARVLADDPQALARVGRAMQSGQLASELIVSASGAKETWTLLKAYQSELRLWLHRAMLKELRAAAGGFGGFASSSTVSILDSDFTGGSSGLLNQFARAVVLPPERAGLPPKAWTVAGAGNPVAGLTPLGDLFHVGVAPQIAGVYLLQAR